MEGRKENILLLCVCALYFGKNFRALLSVTNIQQFTQLAKAFDKYHFKIAVKEHFVNEFINSKFPELTIINSHLYICISLLSSNPTM